MPPSNKGRRVIQNRLQQKSAVENMGIKSVQVPTFPVEEVETRAIIAEIFAFYHAKQSGEVIEDSFSNVAHLTNLLAPLLTLKDEEDRHSSAIRHFVSEADLCDLQAKATAYGESLSHFAQDLSSRIESLVVDTASQHRLEDEIIYFTLAKLIEDGSGCTQRLRALCDIDDWNNLVPNALKTCEHALRERLAELHCRFSVSTYRLKKNPEIVRIFNLIWQNLKALYCSYQKDVLNTYIATDFSVENSVICNLKDEDMYMSILYHTDAFNTAIIDKTVSEYCLSVAAAGKSASLDPTRDLSQPELKLLTDHALYGKNGWNRQTIRAMHCAVARLEYLMNGTVRFDRLRGVQQNGLWHYETISPRILVQDAEMSGALQDDSDDEDEPEFHSNRNVTGLNYFTGDFATLGSFPENRAQQCAENKNIVLDMNTPGITSLGKLPENCVSIPPRHCASPARMTNSYAAENGVYDMICKLGRALFSSRRTVRKALAPLRPTSVLDCRHKKHIRKNKVVKSRVAKETYPGRFQKLVGGGTTRATRRQAAAQNNDDDKDKGFKPKFNKPADFVSDPDAHARKLKKADQPSTSSAATTVILAQDTAPAQSQRQLHPNNQFYLGGGLRRPLGELAARTPSQSPGDGNSASRELGSPAVIVPYADSVSSFRTHNSDVSDEQEIVTPQSVLRRHQPRCHPCPVFEGQIHHDCGHNNLCTNAFVSDQSPVFSWDAEIRSWIVLPHFTAGHVDNSRTHSGQHHEQDDFDNGEGCDHRSYQNESEIDDDEDNDLYARIAEAAISHTSPGIRNDHGRREYQACDGRRPQYMNYAGELPAIGDLESPRPHGAVTRQRSSIATGPNEADLSPSLGLRNDDDNSSSSADSSADFEEEGDDIKYPPEYHDQQHPDIILPSIEDGHNDLPPNQHINESPSRPSVSSLTLSPQPPPQSAGNDPGSILHPVRQGLPRAADFFDDYTTNILHEIQYDDPALFDGLERSIAMNRPSQSRLNFRQAKPNNMFNRISKSAKKRPVPISIPPRFPPDTTRPLATRRSRSVSPSPEPASTTATTTTSTQTQPSPPSPTCSSTHHRSSLFKAQAREQGHKSRKRVSFCLPQDTLKKQEEMLARERELIDHDARRLRDEYEFADGARMYINGESSDHDNPYDYIPNTIDHGHQCFGDELGSNDVTYVDDADYHYDTDRYIPDDPDYDQATTDLSSEEDEGNREEHMASMREQFPYYDVYLPIMGVETREVEELFASGLDHGRFSYDAWEEWLRDILVADMMSRG